MCYIIAVYVRFNVKLKQVNRASWTHDNTCWWKSIHWNL